MIKYGWMKLREAVQDVLFYKMSILLEDRYSKAVVGQAMLYGSEYWAMNKKKQNSG